ncbi:MAG: permease-like cell division protein FtsX [bacterium]
MKGMRFHLRQGLQTLLARPGLSVLAVLLLAVALWLCAATFGTLLLLQNLRAEILKTLAADIELRHDITDVQRARIANLAATWSGVAEVSYISPDSALRIHSAEVGENLEDIFGDNPFPPVLRVRLHRVSLREMNRLAMAAIGWEGVADVVYPRELLRQLGDLAAKIRGSGGLAALGLVLLSFLMVWLTLRAQFLGRRKEWRLLMLLGMSGYGLRRIGQVQAVIVGAIAGLLASGGACALVYLYNIVFLETMSLPLWYYLAIFLGGAILMLPIGLTVSRSARLSEK